MVHEERPPLTDADPEEPCLEYVTMGGGEEELAPPARPRSESPGSSWSLYEGGYGLGAD